MRVFIIGGGGSLKGFDFNRLKNEKTIAINCAFKFIKPTHLLWCDPDVFGNNKDEINAIPCEKYTLFDSIHPECSGCKSFKPSTLFYGSEGLTKGLYGSPHEGQWISGPLAISLAFALGYDQIYLLGYDGGDVNGLHFHPYSREEEVFSSRNYWYDAFKGQPIHNCSLKSYITQFPKISIDEVLSCRE